MGTWNESILGNDTSCEVQAYFKRMYKYQEGNKFKWTVEEIADSLYSYYYDSVIELPSEKAAVLFALALGLWEVNALTPKIKSIVKDLIDKRIDYNAWKELGADEKSLKKRLAVTQEFHEKISSENSKPKSRELIPKKLSALVRGDCLTFQYKNHYYGIVATNDARNHDDGTNDFLFVDIKSSTLPKLKDFQHASFILNEDLVNHLSNIEAEPSGGAVLFALRLTKPAIEKALDKFIPIGNISLSRTFFERTTIMVTDFSVKKLSLDKLVITAIELWSHKPWMISNLTVASDIEAPKYKVDKINITIGKIQIPLKDVYVKIDDSLWHINVWIFVEHVPAKQLEDHWLVFNDIIQQKTGREVNGFYLLDGKNVDRKTLIPIGDIDKEKYSMKYVKDTSIV